MEYLPVFTSCILFVCMWGGVVGGGGVVQHS